MLHSYARIALKRVCQSVPSNTHKGKNAFAAAYYRSLKKNLEFNSHIANTSREKKVERSGNYQRARAGPSAKRDVLSLPERKRVRGGTASARKLRETTTTTTCKTIFLCSAAGSECSSSQRDALGLISTHHGFEAHLNWRLSRREPPPPRPPTRAPPSLGSSVQRAEAGNRKNVPRPPLSAYAELHRLLNCQQLIGESTLSSSARYFSIAWPCSEVASGGCRAWHAHANE